MDGIIHTQSCLAGFMMGLDHKDCTCHCHELISRRIKAPGIQAVLDDLSHGLGLQTKSEAITNGNCSRCRQLVDLANPATFRDEASLREYHITGLCQDCQDIIFAEEEGDEDDYD